MTDDLTRFFTLVIHSPPLLITVLLTLGVIFVNGWTDAPNAIATCVTTRSLRPRTAVLLSALFNFLGTLVMTAFNATVAMTIKNMVNFGTDTRLASTALCAALCAIILWAVVAWAFGIPTSESHALIAGLSGAAMALQNGLGGINGSEWIKVLYGLLLSVAFGFVSGFVCARLTAFICRHMDRRKTQGFFRGAQIFGGAAMSFMHGAQDGQKFMGVLMLGISLASGDEPNAVTVSLPVILLCSVIMSLGTSVGGYKIIQSVGMKMVRLEAYQGFAADMAGAFCLLLSSLFGLPVSTTHTKTTAVMGVGAAKRFSALHWQVIGQMALAWVCTFPGCGVIGYVMAKLFIHMI